MGDLQVIYDPDLEVAAIVDTEGQIGWGPAMVGPDAREVLQAWLDSTPFDVSEADTYTARGFFRSCLGRLADLPEVSSDTHPQPPSSDGGRDDVADAALADREAADGGAGPPELQPADTDMEADQGTPATVVTCPHCNGDKVISYGDGSPDRPCPLCNGAGLIRQEVNA